MSTKTFREYQQEKTEREWNDRVRKQKEAMGNAERVQRATDWKRIGNDKFKSGNFYEARDYYREGIIYVEDLVDARKQERNELLVPLYCNLAQVSLKLEEHSTCEDAAGKALAILEVPKNGMQQFRSKAQFRRGLARKALGKLEEARDDLAIVHKLQPGNEEVNAELSVVREQLAARAREARERMGGFLNKAADGRLTKEERQKRDEEKRRRAEEKRAERKARAEQRQQMQGAFEKLSKGAMLYEEREKEMEPIRKKEQEKRQTLELEQNLLNIIDDSKGLPKTEEFDDFMKKKQERAFEQHSELDQKKKILDKHKKEEQWAEDDVWKGQRDNHRRRLEAERRAKVEEKAAVALDGVAGGSSASSGGPKAMWESKEVARWCEQRLRDMLLGTYIEGGEDLEPDVVEAFLGKSQSRCDGYVLKAVLTDVLKFVGDAAVMQLNASKPPLYYYDYFLKLDWEVAVVRRGDRAYRTADELIGAAASKDDGKAPPSVTENRVLAGTFKIREFCSEEEPPDGDAWDLAIKVKKTCDKDPRLSGNAEELRNRLRDKVSRLLLRWAAEYRKHWS